MTHSNGVKTTLTYDNRGWITRIQDGSVIDIQYTLNATGHVTGADMTLPLDPTSLLTAGTDLLSFDDASQISSAGYSYDTRGRLTASPKHIYSWDGASRLTGIDAVTLDYNGRGDLMTRAEDGTTVRHYYNYALRLNPIVAEKIRPRAS